jgi:hypothetical protein
MPINSESDRIIEQLDRGIKGFGGKKGKTGGRAHFVPIGDGLEDAIGGELEDRAEDHAESGASDV